MENLPYVANAGSNNVSVIDTSFNTVVATIPVGSTPVQIAVSLLDSMSIRRLQRQRGCEHYWTPLIQSDDDCCLAAALISRSVGYSPGQCDLCGE